jgi:hypothetical protein
VEENRSRNAPIVAWLMVISGMIIALSLTWSPGPQDRMCAQYAKPSVVS